MKTLIALDRAGDALPASPPLLLLRAAAAELLILRVRSILRESINRSRAFYS